MGTQQALTTRQLEILILIKEIEDMKAQSDDEQKTHNSEILDNIFKDESGEKDDDTLEYHRYLDESWEKAVNTLDYYGYLDDFKLTIDGKQYIELFMEYLENKAENPSVEHVTFSLINIEKLEVKLEATLAKMSNNINLEAIIDLLEMAKQGKNWFMQVLGRFNQKK